MEVSQYDYSCSPLFLIGPYLYQVLFRPFHSLMLQYVTQLVPGTRWRHFALFGLGLLGSSCSKADEEAKPIAPNTFQLTVAGKQLTFPLSLATAVRSQQGTHWEITGAANPSTASTGSTIVLYLDAAAGSSAGTGVYKAPTASRQAGASSVYGVVVPNGTQNVCGTYLGGYITYQTFTGSPEQFEVRLQAVDTGQHTVSGTFAGIYYKGCDKVTISDGQFNLPYVDKP